MQLTHVQGFRDAEKEIGVPCLSLIVGNRVHTAMPAWQQSHQMGKRLQTPRVKNNSEEIPLKFKEKKLKKKDLLKKRKKLKRKKVFIKNRGLTFNFFRGIL